MAWLGTERANLTAAVAAAADTGHPELAWRIAVLLWPIVVRQVHDGWEPTLRRALAAATGLGDLNAQSRLSSLLGWVLTENGEHTAALEHLGRAPDLALRAADPLGQVVALVHCAVVLERLGDLPGAGERREQAARLARGLGHPGTEVQALYSLAVHRLATGRPQEALAHARRGLELASDEQSQERRALLLEACGDALHALGRGEEARRCRDRAAALTEGPGQGGEGSGVTASPPRR